MKRVAEGVYRIPFEEFYPTLKEYGAEPEALEMFWEEYIQTPKDDAGRLKERFLWWPIGTAEDNICRWFDEKYPNGLRELMRKRQIKRFGEDYVQTFENLEKSICKTAAHYFLMTPPEIAKIRNNIMPKLGYLEEDK